MELLPRRIIMQKLLLIKCITRRLVLLMLMSIFSVTVSMAYNSPISNSTDNHDTANPKLTIIQEMYAISSEQELGSEVLLERYSSEVFKQALALERKVAESGMICGSGGDVMWQSQDTDFQEAVTFAIDAEDRVVVQLSDRDTLSYVLTCEKDTCLIEDIYDFGGSVKEMLLADCQ